MSPARPVHRPVRLGIRKYRPGKVGPDVRGAGGIGRLPHGPVLHPDRRGRHDQGRHRGA